jgi:hypothetical protein
MHRERLTFASSWMTATTICFVMKMGKMCGALPDIAQAVVGQFPGSRHP